jgi:histidine triad (HIT) family protein
VAGCTFCEIVAGRVSAHIVLEDELVMAFLDVRPVFKGHALLIPRDHIETLPELPPALVQPLFTAAQRLATAVVDGLGAQGSFVAINNVVSQSVPHLHVHVVPRTKGDGLKGFFWPRTKYASEDEAAAIAARLRDALSPAR